MEGIMNWMEKYILPIASAIGNQKHLVAIRDAFIATIPATMAGAIAVLLNAFVRDFPGSFGWGGFVEAMAPVISINGLVWQGTLAIMAIVFALTLGFNIAKAYKVDQIAGAVVSLVAFFISLTTTATTQIDLAETLPHEVVEMITEAGGVVAHRVVEEVEIANASIQSSGWGFFSISQLGGAGLFTALIFGLIATIIYAHLMKRKITIKLPSSVPPAVSSAFAAIIPAAAGVYVVGIINYLFQQLTGEVASVWIAESIQRPLMDLSQGFGAVMIIVLLVHLLWFFGIHGTNVMSPILQTLYGTAMNQNANAFQSGESIPFQWVAGSFDAFVWPGGAGVTLMLVVAIIVLSRRSDYQTLGKLAIAPCVFNINEPVMFGMPIVLNALYMIPFIVAPLLTAAISYGATVLELVNPVVVNVIWVMPPGISGFLATGGDWRAIVLTIVNLIVSFIVWAPFVLAANRIKTEGSE